MPVPVHLDIIIPCYNKAEILEYTSARLASMVTKLLDKSLISFAWNGIRSLSIIPLRLITTIGFLIFILSCIMCIWGKYIWKPNNVPATLLKSRQTRLLFGINKL